MESENITDPYEDNRDVDQSRQSLRSTKKDSRESSSQRHKKNTRDKIQDEDKKDDSAESRSKTRTRHSDPDRDQMDQIRSDQMEMGGGVVGRFTQMNMRMSLIQRALSHLIPSPGLHPLLLKEGCGLRGFLAGPSTRQVYKERMYVWTDEWIKLNLND